MSTRLNIILALGLSFGVLTGCRGETSKDPPIVGIRNMYDQDKYKIQEESEFFDDHRTMRPIIEGTVSRERDVDVRIAQGRTEDETGYVLTIPEPEIHRNQGPERMLQRGQERYNIYCSPCHDKTGSGNGIIRKHALATGAAAFAPASLHQDRIRHMPDGQLFATISNGKNNMPAYAAQIPVDDRWAIVSYVRALEVSQAKVEPNL